MNCLIQIDGGVNLSNAQKLVDLGADSLVAGNAIFVTDNPLETIAQFKQIK